MAKQIGKKAEKQEKTFFQPIFDHYGSEVYYEELNLDGNDKQKEKFIKTIERIIRSSLEYRSYIKYLKTEALLTQCAVMNKLPSEVSGALSIEMHHCPLTLYDLTDIILTKHLRLNLPYTRLSIANEVMNAHYMNQVGIVPLTETMHQIIHNGISLVSKKDIFGNYEEFAEQFDVFLSEEHRNKIEKINKLPDALIFNTRTSILEINPALYLEYDDSADDVVYLKEPEPEIEEELDDDTSIAELLKPPMKAGRLGKKATTIIDED